MKTTKSVWGKALLPAIVVVALAILMGLPFLKSHLLAQTSPPTQPTTCHAVGAVADSCYPFAPPCYSGQAFWLAGLDASVFSIPCTTSNGAAAGSDGFKYIFTAAAGSTTPTSGTFQEFPNGTAHLFGHIESTIRANFGFDVDITFSGFQPAPDGTGPLLELNSTCYGTGPGQVNVANWHFYNTVNSATLTGTGNYAGAVVQLTPHMHLPQFGPGANGKNHNNGGSSWFAWNVLSQPTNHNFHLNPTTPAGQSVDFNLDCTPCTGSIGDFVWQDTNGNGCQDANEPGMANVQVDLFSGCGGTQLITSTMTDSTGHYLFTGLCAGQYNVCFHTPTGFIHTVNNNACNVGGQPPTSTDSNCLQSCTDNCCVCVTLPTDNTNDLTIDCGYIPRCTGSIGDFVWNDLNGNGCQDANEPGMANVQVDLFSGCGGTQLITSTMTDSTGHYLFQNLCAGQYSVCFHTPTGFSHTVNNNTCNVGGQPPTSTDSNCLQSCTDNCCVCVTLPTDNTNDLTIDCGYITTCPPCVNPAFGLGAGAAFSVFELNNGSVSITGPAGGLLGDLAIGPNGKLSMSGDEFVTGTIKLAPGATFSNSAHFNPVVQTNVDLTAAINAAKNLSTTDAGLPCDQTINKVDGSTNINATHAGQNVICIKDVSISGKQVFINNTSNFANVTFVLNVTGQFTLTGGGAGPQIRAGTNVKPADILYNLIGGNTMNVAFSGGGGGTNCCAAIVDGTLLAPNRDINLSPGLVNGEVIGGKNISIVSGSSVKCPVCPSPTPTPTPTPTATPPQQTSNCVNAQGGTLAHNKPTSLTMKYTSGNCSTAVNSQGPPKFTPCQKYCCTESAGGPSGTSTVHIIVSSSSSIPTGSSQRFFEGDVPLNGSFTVSAGTGTTTFQANTYFFIYEGGVLKEMVQLHTSCSAPLIRGETFGALQLSDYQ